MKNKKGHFDLQTLLVTIMGGAVAYAITQKHLLRHLEAKNEDPSRVRK